MFSKKNIKINSSINSKKTYKSLVFILIFFCALFFISFSLGYRVNWKNFSLTQTGSVLISTYPKKTRIFIDNTLMGETNSFLFTNGKLISGLSPEKHHIRIEKDDYLPWSKTLEIEPRSVTEIRHVVLTQKNFHIEIIQGKIHDFIFSDSHALIAYVTQKNVKVWDITKEKEVKLSNNPKEHIGKIIFGANENYIIVESLIKNNFRRYLLNLSSRKIIDIKESDVENYIKIQQYPAHALDFFALSNKNILYKINPLTQHEDPHIVAKNISNFHIFGNSMIYATKNPTFLYEKNLKSGEVSQINSTPIYYFNTQARILKSNNNIAIINTKNELLLYNTNKKLFQKISEKVLHAVFSPDKKKLMWQTKNKIYVYYLKNTLTQPYKNQGDTELLIKSSGDITHTEWFSYDSEHIFFIANHKLKMIELDDREKRNEYYIEEINNPRKMQYNAFSDMLYILDGETLKKISLIQEQ